MGSLPIGAVRFEQVSRRFQVAYDRNYTLKEHAVRKRNKGTREFWAIRSLDLSIEPGESVGVVGRNGSGKSTILKLIAGILHPNEGRVTTAGSIASMLELGAGFHPDFTGRENLFLNGAIFGLSEREVRAHFDEIVDFAEVEDFIDAPVRTYSSGMQMRLAFAVASHVRADIMLMDEIFAVGDASFQRKCLGRMYEFRRHGGTIVFVSHDASAVERICKRAILMEHGQLLLDSVPSEVMAEYARLLAEQESRTASAGVEHVPQSDGDGSWGTRVAEITSARLLSGAGEDITSLRSGEPLTIEVAYTIDVPVESLNLSLSVTSNEGVHCFGTSSERDGHILSGSTPAVIRYTVPHVALFEGSFVVSLHLGDLGGETTFHAIPAALSFNIFPRNRSNGLVDLSGEWEVRPQAASPIAGAH